MSQAPGAAESGPLEARIHSLERSLYLVELCATGRSRWLEAPGGGRQDFRNLGAARTAVARVGAMPVRLVHRSAYDEMVGMGPAASNGIDIALAPARD